MKKLIKKYLFEAGMITGGYPDDGSTGPASDDDRPPGNIVWAPRYVRGKYDNKLTPYNTIWRHDERGNFTWDWFENSTGMDDPDNYSDTLKSMKSLFPDETWKVAWRAIRKKDVPSKEVDTRFKEKGQPYRDADDVLGKHDDDQAGGRDEVAKPPKELETNEMSLLDKIDKFLIDSCGKDHKKKKKKKGLYEQKGSSKVADEILRQINSLDKWALTSWGAKNYLYFWNKSGDGIQFDVRGPKFKGRVLITYDRGSDTYVVDFGNVRKQEWKLKNTIKPVFAQDLVNVLDGQIG